MFQGEIRTDDTTMMMMTMRTMIMMLMMMIWGFNNSCSEDCSVLEIRVLILCRQACKCRVQF